MTSPPFYSIVIMNMLCQNRVKMVVVGKPGTKDTSCVQIKAYQRNHMALPNETSNSLPEIQSLVISSTVKFENFVSLLSYFIEESK